MKHKTGVLLINLGTPDSPSVSDVRSYLSQFLNDPRVIDIPVVIAQAVGEPDHRSVSRTEVSKDLSEIVDREGFSIAVLQRAGKRIAYKKSWALITTCTSQCAIKTHRLPDVLETMRKKNYKKIVVLPMFPQYASASTGSALEEVMRVMKTWWVIPEMKVISEYYDHPLYIDAFVARGKQYNLSEYDHVLFSYHGLPERQVDKVYVNGKCSDHNCENEITEENKFCYKAESYATTRLIAAKLGIPASKYTVCFQSRLDQKWLKPFSDEVVRDCAKKGMKKILVFSPAFTADCLETVIEIGDEYQEIFHSTWWGERFSLVESLNEHPVLGTMPERSCGDCGLRNGNIYTLSCHDPVLLIPRIPVILSSERSKTIRPCRG